MKVGGGMSELYAKTFDVKKVDPSMRRTMYSLLELYYDCTDWGRFNKDLDAKDAVIVSMTAPCIAPRLSTSRTLK